MQELTFALARRISAASVQCVAPEGQKKTKIHSVSHLNTHGCLWAILPIKKLQTNCLIPFTTSGLEIDSACSYGSEDHVGGIGKSVVTVTSVLCFFLLLFSATYGRRKCAPRHSGALTGGEKTTAAA